MKTSYIQMCHAVGWKSFFQMAIYVYVQSYYKGGEDPIGSDPDSRSV